MMRLRHLIATALPLVLLPACNLLHHSSMPKVIADGCPADESSSPEPVAFGAMLDLAVKHGSNLSWEGDGGNSGVVHLSQTDRLTGKTTTMAMRVEHRAISGGRAACSQGVTVVTNMAIDGTSLDQLEIQTTLGVFIDAARDAGLDDHAGTPSRTSDIRALPVATASQPPILVAEAEPLAALNIAELDWASLQWMSALLVVRLHLVRHGTIGEVVIGAYRNAVAGRWTGMGRLLLAGGQH